MKSSVSDRLEELCFNRRDSPGFVPSGFWLSNGRDMSGEIDISIRSNRYDLIVITIATIIVVGRYD